MNNIELQKIVESLDCNWDKKYYSNQVMKNLMNDTYEDFLKKNTKRMPVKKYNSADPVVHENIKLSEISKKIDDQLFIQNKNLYTLYKDVDLNKDGHVCIKDLSNYLHNTLNIPKPEADTFVAMLNKPSNEPLSFQEFHKQIYPGFSQKENYNPGAIMTNVMGITNIDPQKQKENCMKNINFIENVRKGFRVTNIQDNCNFIRLFIL